MLKLSIKQPARTAKKEIILEESSTYSTLSPFILTERVEVSCLSQRDYVVNDDFL